MEADLATQRHEYSVLQQRQFRSVSFRQFYQTRAACCCMKGQNEGHFRFKQQRMTVTWLKCTCHLITPAKPIAGTTCSLYSVHIGLIVQPVVVHPQKLSMQSPSSYDPSSIYSLFASLIWKQGVKRHSSIPALLAEQQVLRPPGDLAHPSLPKSLRSDSYLPAPHLDLRLLCSNPGL